MQVLCPQTLPAKRRVIRFACSISGNVVPFKVSQGKPLHPLVGGITASGSQSSALTPPLEVLSPPSREGQAILIVSWWHFSDFVEELRVVGTTWVSKDQTVDGEHDCLVHAANECQVLPLGQRSVRSETCKGTWMPSLVSFMEGGCSLRDTLEPRNALPQEETPVFTLGGWVFI